MATKQQVIKQMLAHSAKTTPVFFAQMVEAELIPIPACFVKEWAGVGYEKTQSQAIQKLIGTVGERKVVRVYDVYEGNGTTPYVVIQYVGGDFVPYQCATNCGGLVLIPLEHCA